MATMMINASWNVCWILFGKNIAFIWLVIAFRAHDISNTILKTFRSENPLQQIYAYDRIYS